MKIKKKQIAQFKKQTQLIKMAQATPTSPSTPDTPSSAQKKIGNGDNVAKTTPTGKLLPTKPMRPVVLSGGRKVKGAGETKKENGEEMSDERHDVKENDLATSPGLFSSFTPPTREEKKKKKWMEMNSGRNSPSTSTTPNRTTTKKRKSIENDMKSTPNMKIKSQLLERNTSSIDRGSIGKEDNEKEEEEWPDMRPYVPVKTEDSAERKRIKEENRMKKKKKKKMQAAEEAEPQLDSESTVSKSAASDTVPKPNPEPTDPAPSCAATKKKKKKKPNPTVSMPKSESKQPTMSKSSPDSMPKPKVELSVPKSAAPDIVLCTIPPLRSTAAFPMRDSVHKSGGIKEKPVAATANHIRFSSDSPAVKPGATPQKLIDIGRSSAARIPAGEETRVNGRSIKKDSSPEVSTTSSESDDDDGVKKTLSIKIKKKKKKLVKKPEVTSSTPYKVVTPRRKSIDKSPKEEQAVMSSGKKKKKKGVGNAAGERNVDHRDEREEEECVRPSSDLLQMVAERLANGPGLLVFRQISRETNRIAAQQLRTQADSVLHLEEFDDENSFTRDDMTQWWEARREEEDESVRAGKENRSHAQISAYLNMRAAEKQLLRDMDGGMSHPTSAASAVDYVELLQHPLETLDAACLLHESQTCAAARLLRQEGGNLREVWLGHGSVKLVRELKRLKAIERFEHRQATMETLEQLRLLQITELRVDIVDEMVTRHALNDHLVNGVNLRALELNVAPMGPLDGNTASHYALFTKRSYDRADYTDDLEWMIPNVEEGEPDPVTLCMPSLEHLATNVANVRLLWQLRDSTLLLRHLQSLRVGTLSTTKELIASSELFADTKEKRRYKQPGFFALRDSYETVLENLTLRLADRVGVSRLQRDVATMFEAIGELPPSLRRLSISLFYNQFAGVCAPFRKWAGPLDVAPSEATPPDTDHIRIEEMHLHFERAFDLRGLPFLLPSSIKTLSLTINYENEDDAKCLGAFIEMLPELARLECLEDLHIQVWGVRCLQPVVAAVAASSILAARLTRLAVAAYPVDDAFFEGDTAAVWVRASLAAFPRVRTLGVHAAVLVRMIPEERRSGYSWRNGLAWLANQMLVDEKVHADDVDIVVNGACAAAVRRLEDVNLTTAPALPVIDDGEDYTISPHWQVAYDAATLVLTPEDEDDIEEECEDDSYMIANASSDEDDFITDGEDEEDHDGEASHLEKMEEGLEDETERIERRERRRDEKERAAIERGELAEEEDEGELIDFDSISDGEEEEMQPRSQFLDDEAVESDRNESEDEDGGEEKQEESAESECSSEDEDRQREEERMKEEGRRQRRMERKQANLDDEVERRKRKRALESDDEESEGEIVIRRRAPTNKKKKVIIDSDDE